MPGVLTWHNTETCSAAVCEQWEIAVTRKGQVNLKWINFSNRPSPGSHPVAQMIQFNTELKRETRKQNGRFPQILQDDSFLWLQGIWKHLRKNERDSGLINILSLLFWFQVMKLWFMDIYIKNSVFLFHRRVFWTLTIMSLLHLDQQTNQESQ